MNRISSYHDTLRVLQLLICLEELDIESNPVYEFSFRDYLLTLGLTRLNGEVVTTALREKNNQLMSSSCLLYPAKMTPRETSMSFFGSSNVNWKVPKNK